LEKLDNLYDKLKVDKLKEILEIVNSSKK